MIGDNNTLVTPTQCRVAETIKQHRIQESCAIAIRKDDRAMRPIYGCPENFRDSLTTSTATFPEIFHGL